jgi:hypothetical protein
VANTEIKYLGWTIYKWEPKRYGVWYPNGDNTGKQYTSLAKAKAYIKAIEKALSEGKKEPWQMTLEEYAYAEASKYGHGKPRMDWIKAGYGETYRSHKTTVQRALKEGKPVPPEVLRDYPDLRQS